MPLNKETKPMVNGILGGLRTKSRPKVRDKKSGLFPTQVISVWTKLSEESKFIFIATSKEPSTEFWRLYKIPGGPGNLHIIIHGCSQKLSIPGPTPYKQSAERFKAVRWVTLRVQLKAAVRERRAFFKTVKLAATPVPRLEKDRHFEQSDRNAESAKNDLLNLAGPVRTKRWK